MNKFVLGIFVILAIGMADLPSTLACSPDMLHQLAKLTTTTTTTSTQSPGNLDLPAPAPAPQPVLPAAAPVIDGMPEPAPYIPLDPLNSIVISDYTPIIDGYREQPRSIDAGRNVFELEMEGFSICNTDGTEGLTFDEITACRVSYNF